MITNGCSLVLEFFETNMTASLTITFDENKYQLMLQVKQNAWANKRPASYWSVISFGNSSNTGSTTTL